jgi:predicted nucleic acid-binding protein
MPFLLDTNVLSELRRPRPEQKVKDFLAKTKFKELYVSSATLAELRFGIATLADPVRRNDLGQWLSNDVRPMFAGRVLDLNEEIKLRWRFMVQTGRISGRTFAQPDLMIAATAFELNLTLVTRNVKDFVGLGVTILNPWEPQT